MSPETIWPMPVISVRTAGSVETVLADGIRRGQAPDPGVRPACARHGKGQQQLIRTGRVGHARS